MSSRSLGHKIPTFHLHVINGCKIHAAKFSFRNLYIYQFRELKNKIYRIKKNNIKVSQLYYVNTIKMYFDILRYKLLLKGASRSKS